MTRPRRPPPPGTPPASPTQPVIPPIEPPDISPAVWFEALDDELPLALLPVRLEARFLPDGNPTEIVVRVFPDEIHVDSHVAGFTETELELARRYWEWVWRAASDPAAVSEARAWLADQLGPYRAVYVAWASRPADNPPTTPTPPDQALVPPPKLRTVPAAVAPRPGRARLLPIQWAAFVDVDSTTAGPFWAASRVDPELAVTPALVDLPIGADASHFLEAQGLGWMYDLVAAEAAGMVVRIPIADLPDRPTTGYDRIVVVGVAAGSDHDEEAAALLEAHRYTRGLDLLPPGTATNVTDEAPEAAGRLDLDGLFDSEFDRPVQQPDRGPPARLPRKPAKPPDLLSAAPAEAVAMAFGLAGDTALHRAAGAEDPEPELARAANQALWPATWDTWFSDQMSWVSDGSPLLGLDDISFLRSWFVDYVRAEGPLPTLRVGRHPYGILPVSTFERRDGNAVLDHLENTLLDIFTAWQNRDSVPLLDPDASDVAPDEEAEEQASDVGAIYGATPHIRDLRLRPVDDTYRELTDLYSLRLDLVGLMCALVPMNDGSYATPEELDNDPWYQAFVDREPNARGANGVKRQVKALRALLDDLDKDISGNPDQEAAALAIRCFINRFEPRPDGEAFVTGDVLGIVERHQARVEDAQPYLGQLGARDELGTDQAPRLYTAGFGEEGTEVPVGVLVAPGTDDGWVGDLLTWLTDLHDAVAIFSEGGSRPPYDVTTPYPLLRQLLQLAAATVGPSVEAAALRDGLARLRDLVGTEGAAAIPVLERLLRGTLGLAIYRVDAWMTALVSERLASERLKKPTGLQVGGYGWLVNCAPRDGRVSQGHIHAPSLDHATTAAVLRSGWSAFGTEEGGSPLAVDLSAPQIRAARSLVEGVRSGQELGRLLGGRFERLLHDRQLDRFIDDIRAAVLRGSGHGNRPATRIVDGLLIARAYTEGVELTGTEQDVRDELDPIVTAHGGVRRAVDDLVHELDAVADVLFAQAVHALLRGDAGVAAPTLAATGSADSGLPAIDLPETFRGGRLITNRVVAVLGQTPPEAWPGAAASVLSVAEPRLEAWVGQLLGPPTNIVADVTVEGRKRRVTLGTLGTSALDAVYGVERLRTRLLASLGAGESATVAAGRPEDLVDDKVAFDEFVTLARAVRLLLGRIRPLGDADLTTDPEVADSRDAAELTARLSNAVKLLPADDPRQLLLEQHRADHSGDTPDLLIERLRIVTVEPVPVLPLLTSGIPTQVAESFSARQTASAQSQSRIAAWLAQAGKVRADLGGFLDAVQLTELATLRPSLSCAVGQSPDTGGPWAADRQPDGSGAVTAWCNLTGPLPAGSVAGFVVDAWTETIPAVKATSGIAIHFDRPSAVAPNAVLLATTRGGESFDLDVVRRCVRSTLTMAQFRALSPDAGHPFLGQFLPAAFVPDDVVVLAAEGEES